MIGRLISTAQLADFERRFARSSLTLGADTCRLIGKPGLIWLASGRCVDPMHHRLAALDGWRWLGRILEPLSFYLGIQSCFLTLFFL